MKQNASQQNLDPQERALEQLLADAKMEFDEAWLTEAEQHVPQGMEERLRTTIAQLDKTEHTSQEPQLPLRAAQVESPEQPPRIGRRFWLRAAACATLVVLVGWGIGQYLQPGRQEAFVDTCRTPEEARQHLEYALAVVTGNGRKAMAMSNESLGRARKQQPDVSKYISFE